MAKRRYTAEEIVTVLRPLINRLTLRHPFCADALLVFRRPAQLAPLRSSDKSAGGRFSLCRSHT